MITKCIKDFNSKQHEAEYRIGTMHKNGMTKLAIWHLFQVTSSLGSSTHAG